MRDQIESECSSSGSVAEWSKALVKGASLFGGVGSNPTAAIYFTPTNYKSTFIPQSRMHIDPT